MKITLASFLILLAILISSCATSEETLKQLENNTGYRYFTLDGIVCVYNVGLYKAMSCNFDNWNETFNYEFTQN